MLIRTMVGIILIYALIIGGCKPAQEKPKKAPVPVDVIQVKETEIPVFKDYIGITQSVAQVDIRARVKGFLTQKNFTEGSWVKKNQLLFVIDPAPFQAKLDLAEADLQKSVAQVDFQTLQEQRFKTLVKQEVAPQERLDQITTDLKVAKANVLVNKANVEQAKINLGYCYMYAPIEGKIGEKYVDVGNLVGGTTNTLLATIVQLDPIYVLFSPSVNDFGEILNYWNNMPFQIRVMITGFKAVFTGKVDLVNNEADQTTSTVLMRGVVDNPKKLLLPGIFVNVRLILSPQQKVLTVPKTAIMETQGQNYIYLVDKENKVIMKTIQTSFQYQDSEVVTSGIKQGDHVIVNGLQKVQPGDIVQPQFITEPSHL